MADPIVFDRKPYEVKYHDLHGELQTIKRRPPEKIHNIWPEDKVELKFKKNDDWQAGEIYEAKHINPKHPNVIQIKSDDESTFVSAYDLELKSSSNSWDGWAAKNGLDPRDEPVNNEYLNWP